MKRVFIVHGWDYNSKMNWYPWLKKELESRGFEVHVPDMPNTSEPKIEAWVSFLKKVVKRLDKNTYFVGHSIGCQAIMRFLENTNAQSGGCVFVGGWIKVKGLEDEEGAEEIARPWMEKPINFEKVKKNSGKIVAIFSDDDYYVSLENADIFKNKLEARTIVEKEKGHFTKDDEITELPSALNALLEISK